MKKISILSLHLGYGGAEKSIVALANLLCEYYCVEIACTYKLYDEPAFKLDKRVNVKYLTNVVPNKKELKNAIKKKNIFLIFKELICSLNVLIKRKRTMIKYIKNSDSNIIISSRYLFNNFLGKYGKKDILKIGWEHNHHHGNIRFAKKVINSSKKLNYLVLVSNNLKEFYEKKLDKCKCVCIPNIVDEIPDITSDLTKKRLISIGRLSIEKGYYDLVKIFNKISKKYPNWRLDIIGDGDEKNKIDKYITENNLEDKVIMHGYRDKEYINKLLQKSSIYLMTSYTESFGIVLIEAMSFGIPCIAYSSAEGACDLIENEFNGYLIDNRDEDLFIEKVEYLIENKEIRNNMKQNCIDTSKKYLGSNIIKLWLDITGDENE